MATILVSCHTTKFTMGMSVEDFTRQNSNADLVESKPGGWYIYRANTHNSRVNKTMFYYFAYGKLVQVDEGQRRPDVVIDQTIHHP